MALAIMANESSNSIDISLLRSNAEVLEKNLPAHLIKQANRFRLRTQLYEFRKPYFLVSK